MKRKHILLIGNSYSDDMAMYIPEICHELHVPIHLEIIGYPGGSVDQHIDFLTNRKPVYVHRTYDYKQKIWLEQLNVSGNPIINSYPWDIVVIQQASYLSGEENSLHNVNEYLQLIKTMCTNPNAKFYWQMTWPYPSFNEFEIFQNDFQRIPQKMYDGIIKNVQKQIVGNSNFSGIIPNGTAVYNALQKFDERSMYRDVVHLSFHIGRYIASLMFVKSVFKSNIENVSTRPFSFSIENAKICKEAVNKANKNPFTRSQMD